MSGTGWPERQALSAVILAESGTRDDLPRLLRLTADPAPVTTIINAPIPKGM